MWPSPIGKPTSLSLAKCSVLSDNETLGGGEVDLDFPDNRRHISFGSKVCNRANSDAHARSNPRRMPSLVRGCSFLAYCNRLTNSGSAEFPERISV